MKKQTIVLSLCLAIGFSIEAKLQIDNFSLGDSETNVRATLSSTLTVTPAKDNTGDDLKVITFNTKTTNGNIALFSIGLHEDELVAMTKLIILDGKGNSQKYDEIKGAELDQINQWVKTHENDGDKINIRELDITISSGFILQAVGERSQLGKLVKLK